MSNSRKLKGRKVPKHECRGEKRVVHFCDPATCPGDDCPNEEDDFHLCGRAYSDLEAAMQIEHIMDCPVCDGSGTLGMRIGRHWIGEPRFIWRCTNGCAPPVLREALLGRGIDAGCLGDYGIDGTVYELDGNEPTALYRWFDIDGLLLYIGISDELAARVKGHIKASSWMDFAASSTIERHPTRFTALDAEEAAIKAERPLFNHQHNSSPEAQKRLVEYLIKHNRLDLLTPAVSRG